MKFSNKQPPLKILKAYRKVVLGNWLEVWWTWEKIQKQSCKASEIGDKVY